MSDLTEQIFSNELILSKILSSLTLKQLTKSCVLVNNLWNRVSQNVIESRVDVQHVFELYRIGRHHNSDNRTANSESYLSDNKDYEFISECFEQIEAKLLDKIGNHLNIWPNLAITFFGNFCPHSKRPERLMALNGSFRQYLSPETQLLNVVSSAGVIGSYIGPKQSVTTSSADTSAQSSSANSQMQSKEPLIEPIESQAHVDNCAGISMLVFPKYPNVEIDVFDDRNLIPLEKLNSRSDLKCLIVLANTCSDPKTHRLKEFKSINQLKAKYDNKIAIGGIITDEINYFSNNLNTTRKKSRDFYGLAFSGPNVRACSLLIKTLTPEDTENKFREFRQNLNFNPNLKTCETIGFLFICTGRGVHTDGYRTSNVEASLFRKVFPDVKVVGVFGQGEFGHNYWPSITRKQQLALTEDLQEDQRIAHELWHFYTTVLILVNLPKK